MQSGSLSIPLLPMERTRRDRRDPIDSGSSYTHDTIKIARTTSPQLSKKSSSSCSHRFVKSGRNEIRLRERCKDRRACSWNNTIGKDSNLLSSRRSEVRLCSDAIYKMIQHDNSLTSSGSVSKLLTLKLNICKGQLEKHEIPSIEFNILSFRRSCSVFAIFSSVTFS